MGMMEVLLEPAITRMTMRMRVMKSPEMAVPTVNLETTFCER